MKENRNIVIYDIETLSNCFTYTAVNVDTGELYQYVIWNGINQFHELMKHLSSLRGQIGFNNINFDYPVLHSMILNREFLRAHDAEFIARWIYKTAQRTITTQFPQVRDNDVFIHQLDLFKIWHYDNVARMTSLKKLQIAMNSDNVMDMPIHHTEEINSREQIELILEYNLHDVEKTKEFYELSKDKIDLRRGLYQKYGLRCFSFSDTKIGEDLMLKLYCEATKQDESVIRRKRTRRKKFKFKDCIPKYIKFETEEFKGLLEYLRGIEVDSLKGSFKYSVDYNDFQFDYGTGGIHGSAKAGVYKTDNEGVIIDADVASLYPNLAITLGIYPKHLGKEFLEVYENGLLKPRLEAKKNGDKIMDAGFKLSLNSVYGKSNSEYSWLCDPLYTLKTTLGGQLALSMLVEMATLRIPELQMIQINTDGLTVKIPEDKRKDYWEVCKEWESITGLTLEYASYTKMIIRDVNNYISVFKDGYVKRIGTFKLNSEMRDSGEYHKSFSQGIVPIAVSEYFLNDVPVEKTVRECKDVFEFTKMANSVGKWWTETFEVDEEGNEINVIPQQKNNRYILTNKGVRFRKSIYKIDKKTNEEKRTNIEYESDRFVTILNNYKGQTVEELDINYDYYIEECYKIIHLIDGTTERLEKEKREERERLKKEREENNFLKYCVNKIPTQRQWGLYKREWLIEKYTEMNQHENFYSFVELDEIENGDN